MRQRPRLSRFDNRGMYHTAHYIATLSATGAPSSAPAYSVVVVGASGRGHYFAGSRRRRRHFRDADRSVYAQIQHHSIEESVRIVDFHHHHSLWLEQEDTVFFFRGGLLIETKQLYTVCGPVRSAIFNG